MNAPTVAVPVWTWPQATDPARWLSAAARGLDEELHRAGAVLVRGLPLRSAADLAALAPALGGPPRHPGEWFAPRPVTRDGVLGPLPWPADRTLCPHPESSYARRPPARVAVACLRPPADGGDALLADGRAVLAALPDDVTARAEATGWRLVRHFRPYLGVSWPDAFGTGDRARVEAYCAAERITCDWLPDGTLRTERRRPAVRRHPVTGERSWCNQLGFLSRWALLPAERGVLEAAYGPDGLPVTTAFGDGTALGEDQYAAIDAAYRAAERRVAWRRGDLLILDNVLTALGRTPHADAGEFGIALLGALTPEG